MRVTPVFMAVTLLIDGTRCDATHSRATLQARLQSVEYRL